MLAVWEVLLQRVWSEDLGQAVRDCRSAVPVSKDGKTTIFMRGV